MAYAQEILQNYKVETLFYCLSTALPLAVKEVVGSAHMLWPQFFDAAVGIIPVMSGENYCPLNMTHSSEFGCTATCQKLCKMHMVVE